MDIVEKEIILVLTNKYNPKVLEVVNESDMHSGPRGRETHFKVLIVSDYFEGLAPIDRQRDVYNTLDSVVKKIHALSIKAVPVDLYKPNSTFQSPDCTKK